MVGKQIPKRKEKLWYMHTNERTSSKIMKQKKNLFKIKMMCNT
jgi:hypothetical protein